MNILLTLFLMALPTFSNASLGPTRQHKDITVQAREPRKRGIAFNNPNYVKLFNVPESRIAWIYNWHSKFPQIWGPEYIPMLHSDRPDHTGPWWDNVDYCSKVGPGRMNVLSFNEPDQCGNGGSCMKDVDQAVDAHRRWVEPLRKYGDRMKLGSPAVTNGGAGMGLDWLSKFIHQCVGCKIDFVAIHWYDSATNVEYFKRHVEQAHRITNRDVWITEFGPHGSEDQKIDFLRDVLPWLDNQDYVFRYAMFMASPGELINNRGDGLSRLGQVYNTL